MRRDDVPPIVAKDERDKAWMRSWMNIQLDRMLDQEFGTGQHMTLAEQEEWLEFLKRAAETKSVSEEEQKLLAVEAADRYGDVEPLRRLYPDLARFINRPRKPKRGKKFETRPQVTTDLEYRLQAAIADVKKIRDIRQKLIDGKRNGPIGGMTVEDIAAERWGLTEDEVVNKRLSRERLKKLADAK